MSKEHLDLKFDDQKITITGEYSKEVQGNPYGSNDTARPNEPSDFEITEVIWHKKWGGNIIDIDVTDLLQSFNNGDIVFDMEATAIKRIEE